MLLLGFVLAVSLVLMGCDQKRDPWICIDYDCNLVDFEDYKDKFDYEKGGSWSNVCEGCNVACRQMWPEETQETAKTNICDWVAELKRTTGPDVFEDNALNDLRDQTDRYCSFITTNDLQEICGAKFVGAPRISTGTPSCEYPDTRDTGMAEVPTLNVLSINYYGIQGRGTGVSKEKYKDDFGFSGEKNIRGYDVHFVSIPGSLGEDFGSTKIWTDDYHYITIEGGISVDGGLICADWTEQEKLAALFIERATAGETVSAELDAEGSSGAGQAQFEQSFASCEAGASFLADEGFASYHYEILGERNGKCAMETYYPTNPNPAWANKKMTCEYDHTKDFETAIQEVGDSWFTDNVGNCQGELFEVMTNG